MRKTNQQKGKRPFPGMGKFVVITRYPGENVWSAYAGANTPEKARKLRWQLSQYPDSDIAIVENVNGVTLPDGALIHEYNYQVY